MRLISLLAMAAAAQAVPTYSPTVIPVSVAEVTEDNMPIAMHQLVVVDNAGDSVVRLKSFDLNSFNLTYQVTTLTSIGAMYQLSQVFSSYGYEPKAGGQFLQPATVTGSNNRLYYKRPSPDSAGVNKWDSFEFTVTGQNGVTSYPGTVTLVPPSGSIVGSTFLLGAESWTIQGNKGTALTYEPYSRGLLNHYIMGADDTINIKTGGADQSLWYFVAPAKFLGNVGIAYGGSLSFTLSSFAGDFSTNNGADTPVVLLECAECDGPVSKGITLAYRLSTLSASPNGAFLGKPKHISLPLTETGWLKHPQNSLADWIPASRCDVVQVLSRLSKVSILGDWTPYYETVALDDVKIVNTKGKLPLCAMSRPDASICTC